MKPLSALIDIVNLIQTKSDQWNISELACTASEKIPDRVIFLKFEFYGNRFLMSATFTSKISRCMRVCVNHFSCLPVWLSFNRKLKIPIKKIFLSKIFRRLYPYVFYKSIWSYLRASAWFILNNANLSESWTDLLKTIGHAIIPSWNGVNVSCIYKIFSLPT